MATVQQSCEHRVLKALTSHTKTLSLNNSNIVALPQSIGRLKLLTYLSAKNNGLKALPSHLANLTSLNYLNLGSNQLESQCLSHLLSLSNLDTLHLFKNNLLTLPNQFFRSLFHLRVLNLNDNHLTSLSADLSLLQDLEYLGLSNNQITHLPSEIGKLHRLLELHLDGNRLSNLPSNIGTLQNLQKLHLQKNQLKKLPDSIGGCKRLWVLDVSSNKLEFFPSQLEVMKLREFHFENNPLLPYIPVPADQCQEVLQLREIAARNVVKELRKNKRFRNELELTYMDLARVLNAAGTCAVCGEPYVHSWLQCVKFKSIKKVIPSLHSVTAIKYVPLYTPICSYHCFNSDDEECQYFGIAIPDK